MFRTESDITQNKSLWDEQTKSNRKLLKNYISCENEPIKLRNYQENVEVLFLTPPDPLHVIYLGPVNDTWKCSRK